MSWYIKKIGKRAAVFTEVENDINLPPEIKAACLSVLGAYPGAPNGVRVEGFGHSNEGYKSSADSSISKLEIEPFPFIE